MSLPTSCCVGVIIDQAKPTNNSSFEADNLRVDRYCRPMSKSILGNAVRRIEDPKMLTSGATYVDDVRDPLLEGAAHVHFVRSTMAHATLRSIDVSEAKSMPGVLAVVTGRDLSITNLPFDFPSFPAAMARPFLAADTVRYVGEPIVAIITELASQGEDAAEQVVIDYEPLPVLVDPELAVHSDIVLHPAHGSNIATAIPGKEPIDFSGYEVVVSQRIVNSRIAAAPLEIRSAASAWGSDGRLHHWVSSQGPHPYRGLLTKVYGLEASQIRVVTPDVGGGFGAKALPYPEDVMLPDLARIVGRPVRWFGSRTDDMVNLGHGRAQTQFATLAGRRDGTLEAYHLRVIQDAGAFPRYGAMLPMMTKLMQPGVYSIDRVAFESQSVVTNTTPVAPFRGAGRPEATAALERMVDMFAAEIGMDPVEVRRKNFLQPDQFPLTTKGGASYDCGNYEGALDLALELAGYGQLREEQAKRRAANDPKLLGIGVCAYVEVTAGSGGSEYGSVEILENGKVRALTGSLPYGTGHDTSWAMLISERTGIPMEDIEIVHGDTDVVPRGGLTGGSRSLQLAGTSMFGAAGMVRDQAKSLAAELLEANVDDVVLDTDRAVFHVAGTPALTRSWSDVAVAHAAKGEGPLRAECEFNQAGGTFPSGVHITVVEVDSETGHVCVQRHITCDDAGRILNPMLVEGQVHGGVGQGIAQALLEEFRYDEDGNPLTSNFADYGVISSAELPSIERVALETPSPMNELGAKGIGESGTIGSTPAVQNAVVDALAHLGIRHLDMPATSEKVWRAIQSVRQS